MALCTACGYSNDNSASFCAYCGAKLSPASPDPTVTMAEDVFEEAGVPAPETESPAPSFQSDRPRRSFASVFFSILLCILSVILLSSLLAPVIFRCAVSEDGIFTMLRRIELDEIPASVLDSSDDSLKDQSLADYFCDTVNDTLAEEMPAQSPKKLTPGKLDDAIDETSFLPFLAKHTSGIVNTVLDGKSTYRIPERDIVSLMERNADFLEKELRIDMDLIDIDASAEEFVEDAGLDEIELFDSTDPDAQSALQVISTIFSPVTIAGLCFLLLILLVLLFLANRRTPMIAVRDLGIVGLFGSVLPVLLTGASNLGVLLFAGKHALPYLLCIVVSSAYNSSLFLTGSIFVVSIVLLVVSHILQSIQKKKA